MFDSTDNYFKFTKIIRALPADQVENAAMFVREYPDAGIDDHLKAFSKLKEGWDIDMVIASYRKYLIKNSLIEEEDKPGKVIFTMDDCSDEMFRYLKEGRDKGSTTYIDGGINAKLDNAWTWRLREFNVWSGYANEGKSAFIRMLCLVKAIMDKWPIAFYAPEDYPAAEFFDELIHTASGHTTDKDNPGFIGNKLYKQVMDQIKEYFYYVYLRPPYNSLLSILKQFIPLIKEKGVKVCVLDPLLKVTRPKQYIGNDAQYMAYITTICTDFSREFNVSLHLVTHQLTPRLQENGLYAKPNMYMIKGGGSLADGADNVLSTWRKNYAADKLDTEVIFTSQKIKKQKLVGVPQDIPFRFDRKKNRFVSFDGEFDVFNFDEILDIPRIKLLFNN